MAEIGGEEWKWLKKHGEFQDRGKRKPVKERKLESVLPAIEFLKAHAGIQGRGVSENECDGAERQIGFPLPVPLKEIWENIPCSVLSGPSRFLSLKEIEAEEERVHFLSGEQGVPEYRLKKDSPMVYITGSGGDDVPFDLLDGFLTAELCWNIMRNEKAGSVLVEMPDCPKAVLSSRGKLGRFLKPCFRAVTKGCRRQLYHWPEQDVIGLYEVSAKTLYLYAPGEAPIERLEEASGISLSRL